ncbi:MAG: hypothetical protein A2487_05000 [Candidatus Raymondbacteria bacterium RifOxyC12_full_50_8]|uniref:SGNH hydrolase-type esterase domain-containing protein n=1 Tax=Candidatus Raymondbacteria bacterium RIFOXYD12_FULL_49_13 TaxID=1817890 RepID=A0A1F7FHG9_UNCRA|nr:MAG: hypothetical protein A2248_22285 [Candidatus Raymondbacteria bacterium RIFOXYA2_FULL_49_16]OGK00115.1 MAG: hypothetical protein A2487_05000 [Candidatus Raymondbacteria bacterium RifOxyC12_full_50_8]OGK06155.1 MAG: hypothetical protein A2519_22755 [Candidatus Raymondbacteria bacterium RIFOXYD12_FULL_49_13]OGP42833.1 MAG: hypothetical protein A2324_16120 [Candidatus Raymondbacteria bacterium RIFOXYB2_FULL_49_35]
MLRRVFLVCALVVLPATMVHSAACADFDPYILYFDSAAKANYYQMYTAWEQDNIGWNKWRVAQIGNSITYAVAFMGTFREGVDRRSCTPYGMTYLTMACLMNGGDSINCPYSVSWLYDDKGGSHGNESGQTAQWGCGVTDGVLKNDKNFWAIIEFGTNESWSGVGGGPAAFPDNMRCVIDACIANNVMPVVTVIPPCPSCNQASLQSVNDAIKQIAQEKHIMAVDAYAAMMAYGGDCNIQGDGVHPNPGGTSTDATCTTSKYVFTDLCMQCAGNSLRSGLTAWAFIRIKNEVINGMTSVDYNPFEHQALPGDLTVMPNPCNPSATIYLMVKNQYIDKFNGTVSIYSYNGQLVRSFAVTPVQGHSTRIEWDGKDMNGAQCAAGIYVVSAPAGGKRLQVKVSLIK